jgi:hypothetical protein
MDKFIAAMTWVINNSTTFLGIMGAATGAAVGALVAGPPGAALGFGIGAAAGDVLGRSIEPSKADLAARAKADAVAQQKKVEDQQYKQMLKWDAIPAMLQNFNKLNSGVVNQLTAEEKLNTKTLVDLNYILTSGSSTRSDWG